ncbi:hypothetical protein M378DRAFT_961681 [Amanita muscaria Koide BX008]|uniref:Uncharacterized protein n=1 Tax=Amanita muscaria (strain Koide BX008) TaxID=946122 RepID=A0A0C2SAT1_AMAMK|nr:hypothetical protein M378DRAFT_961681 [Amanita muscaria Koide BX008]
MHGFENLRHVIATYIRKNPTGEVVAHNIAVRKWPSCTCPAPCTWFNPSFQSLLSSQLKNSYLTTNSRIHAGAQQVN